MNTEDYKTLQDNILNDLENTLREKGQIIERTTYLMMLNGVLVILKDGLGRYIENYYLKADTRNTLALNFTDGDIGSAIYQAFQPVFLILEESARYYGYEERNVQGIPFEQITGINISPLGIPTIIPKSLNLKPEESIVVELKDLDKVRLSELSSLSAMAYGNPANIKLVKDTINTHGGICLDPLFDD